MNQTQRQEAPNDTQLGILAMNFRSTKDEADRSAIAQEYSSTVAKLIESGEWRELPPMEDQLPDDWMPAAFFEYWSLRPPLHRKQGA